MIEHSLETIQLSKKFSVLYISRCKEIFINRKIETILVVQVNILLLFFETSDLIKSKILLHLPTIKVNNILRFQNYYHLQILRLLLRVNVTVFHISYFSSAIHLQNQQAVIDHRVSYLSMLARDYYWHIISLHFEA